VREVIRAQQACGLRAPSGVGETMGQSGTDVSGNQETMFGCFKEAGRNKNAAPLGFRFQVH
jgi:hypothetical protein